MIQVAYWSIVMREWSDILLEYYITDNCGFYLEKFPDIQLSWVDKKSACKFTKDEAIKAVHFIEETRPMLDFKVYAEKINDIC